MIGRVERGAPTTSTAVTDAWLERLRAFLLRIDRPLTAIYGVVATTLAIVAANVQDWFVMTDELLYERLAISVASTFSPLPTVSTSSTRSSSRPSSAPATCPLRSRRPTR
jgi:hypothetical protein